MRNSHEVLKHMIRTEKGSSILAQNKYLFKVDSRANKIEIKNAVENVYKVKVDSVNVMIVRGKKKRVRLKQGMTPSWKKAIVTLKPENRIEVT
ncbi:MAG TPA: 50S ribosomal protein L23 [Candidatus Omnitrophota bacterium]|nr:50S ribosomal protein L23 [Candidatus Omnitrophota bacterium]